jgi:hypothetical protein
MVGSRNQIVRVGAGVVPGGWVPCVAAVGAFWSCSKHFPHRSRFTSFRASAVGYVVTSLRDSQEHKIRSLLSSEVDRLCLSTFDPQTSSSMIAQLSCNGLPRIFSMNSCEKGVYGWFVFER